MTNIFRGVGLRAAQIDVSKYLCVSMFGERSRTVAGRNWDVLSAGHKVLRLRHDIRFADVVAPLRMTHFGKIGSNDDYGECG